LSYLPQRVRLPDSLTTRETLRFYSRLRKLPATSADSLIESSDVQLKGFADRPVGEFSGGMVQRLGVAAALLPDAPVLVLDEPTASLDPEGALALRNLLGSLKRRGKAVLFSTHLLADAEQIAHRVAIIVGGRLAAVEPVEDLQRNLLERVVLRVTLTNAEEEFAEVALRAGAREARLEGVTLLITSSAHSRLRILRAIEEAGGNIERFATDEPLIEEFYLRYVNAKTVDR